MPVSQISGIAGTVNAPQNPLEGFAESIIRAKQMQKQEAMGQLEMMAKLVQDSRGTFMPDPKEVEKLAKKAGMPGLITTGSMPEGGESIGPTKSNMLEMMGARAKKLGEVESAQQEAQLAQAEFDKAKLAIETALADPEATPEKRAKTMTAAVFTGQRTFQQAMDADVMQHLNPTQKEALVERNIKTLMGEPTEQQLNERAQNLVPSLLDDYDGDTGKAIKAANEIVRGQVPTDQPSMTTQRLEQEAKIAQTAVQLGWTPTMTAQAMAAKTTDVAKLSEKYGWDPKVVASLKTPVDRQIAVAERGAAAEERRASAEEKRVGIAQQELGIMSRREKSESMLRVAQAYNEISQAMARGAKVKPEMKDLIDQLQAVRQLQIIDKKIVPEDVKKALTDTIMRAITDENGVPVMREEDISTFWGLGSAKGWVLAPPVDTEATKGEAAPEETLPSVFSPETLKHFPQELGRSLEGFLEQVNKVMGTLDRQP